MGRPVGANANDPLQIGVSESEIFPTTVFTSPELSREGARLWIAGYQLSIHELIENDEVPEEFIDTGKLSDISEYDEEEADKVVFGVGWVLHRGRTGVNAGRRMGGIVWRGKGS